MSFTDLSATSNAAEAKNHATLRVACWQAAVGVALKSKNPWAMLLRRVPPPRISGRQNSPQ